MANVRIRCSNPRCSKLLGQLPEGTMFRTALCTKCQYEKDGKSLPEGFDDMLELVEAPDGLITKMEYDIRYPSKVGPQPEDPLGLPFDDPENKTEIIYNKATIRERIKNAATALADIFNPSVQGVAPSRKLAEEKKRGRKKVFDRFD